MSHSPEHYIKRNITYCEYYSIVKKNRHCFEIHKNFCRWSPYILKEIYAKETDIREALHKVYLLQYRNEHEGK